MPAPRWTSSRRPPGCTSRASTARSATRSGSISRRSTIIWPRSAPQFAEAFAVPELFESLYAMTEWSIDKFLRHGDGGTGCFMMSTAMPEAAEDPEISRVVREAMESLERAMLRRFEKAIEDGQIAAGRRSADPGDDPGRQPLRAVRPRPRRLFARRAARPRRQGAGDRSARSPASPAVAELGA